MTGCPPHRPWDEGLCGVHTGTTGRSLAGLGPSALAGAEPTRSPIAVASHQSDRGSARGASSVSSARMIASRVVARTALTNAFASVSSPSIAPMARAIDLEICRVKTGLGRVGFVRGPA